MSPLVFLREQMPFWELGGGWGMGDGGGFWGGGALSAIPAEDAVNWLSVLAFPRTGLCAAKVGGACVLQPL